MGSVWAQFGEASLEYEGERFGLGGDEPWNEGALEGAEQMVQSDSCLLGTMATLGARSQGRVVSGPQSLLCLVDLNSVKSAVP